MTENCHQINGFIISRKKYIIFMILLAPRTKQSNLSILIKEFKTAGFLQYDKIDIFLTRGKSDSFIGAQPYSTEFLSAKETQACVMNTAECRRFLFLELTRFKMIYR